MGMSINEALNLLNNSKPKSNNAFSIQMNEAINVIGVTMHKYQQIEQIIKDHDNDRTPEDYWYIDKIREVVEDENGTANAKNYVDYGVDITKAWTTVVEQTSIMEQVGRKSYALGKPYEDYLNVSTISENDFLDKVAISDTFDDINPSTNLPYARSFIGKKVSIYNSTQYGSSTMDWVIIGYNHDNSSYTFDLWSSRAMFDSVQFSSNDNKYSNSTARNTIISAITGFNSELQNRLMSMIVVSNGSNLRDNIKLLSMTEMNISNTYALTEGNPYSNYFITGRTGGNIYTDLIRNNSSGSAVRHLLRSRDTYGTSCVWNVNSCGWINVNIYDISFALLPVIRIGVVTS